MSNELIKFKFGNVPKRHKDFAARDAVLTPLFGRCHTDALVKKKTKHLLKLWRDQLGYMHQMGIIDRGRCVKSQNCSPMFTMVDPPGSHCRWQTFCPWCRGRCVSQLYQKLEDRLAMYFKRKASTTRSATGRGLHFDLADPTTVSEDSLSYSFRLAYKSSTRVVANESDLKTYLGMIQSARSPRVRAMKSLGSFIWTSAIPGPIAGAYTVFVRSLHALDEDSEEPTESTIIEDPTRLDLRKAVSECGTYPRELLTYDPGQVGALLNLLQGFNLRGTYGQFRS